MKIDNDLKFYYIAFYVHLSDNSYDGSKAHQ